MKKLSFLFPGQGSQYVGMGKDLFEKSEFAQKTFKEADEILGFHFSKICFEGPEEVLRLTHNTQPALLTVSYILYNLLNHQPDLAAGHSLGEYSAYVCAGAISYQDAVLLVHKRGLYMQEAVPVGQGAMAAVIGVDIEKVKSAIKQVKGAVDIANWNAASQIVISGDKVSVEEAIKLISAPKAVMLPVSAPFHSRLMLPAEKRLAADLDKISFSELKFPIINNVDVAEIKTGDAARDGLKRQVSRPVLWHEAMVKMLVEKEMSSFTEIGAGKVLAGLIRKTARDIDQRPDVYNIQNMEEMTAWKAE